ncbi:hypothetical protein [Halobacillus naozhouensis]|uniref:Uncharacterized protein n=1 Tax=Halobacillus naozhouensis TaxID=554880 RepID=A0ABY8IZU7_9BACI|nr:hypothetical protein [Halobacillus naozhouensis]WFT75331.1 hypothetical protein P9989_02740 [Halobacillus naozhouensis]
MNSLLCLLLVVLIVLTTGTHIHFVWKRNHYKMLAAQLGIISLTIILSILAIYDLSDPSISKLLNMLSPL